MPRVVFGMAAYNRPDSLARTIESLLSQTLRDVAVVIVDDKPSPEVKAIVDTYAGSDPRLLYLPNEIRLGMVGNWRRAFSAAREHFPGSEFFAWASDHDIWHPRWAEVLVGVFDAQPGCVLAFPQMMRVYKHSRRRMSSPNDTAGVTSPWRRLHAATTALTAGNCIYGLFRAAAIERVGGFRAVLLPDRQLLQALARVGQFTRVTEVLWYREVAGAFSHDRQRHMLFAGHTPVYAHLHPTLQHFGVLFWDLAVMGRGRPEHGRAAGAAFALAQLWWSAKRQALHSDVWWRRWWPALSERVTKHQKATASGHPSARRSVET